MRRKQIAVTAAQIRKLTELCGKTEHLQGTIRDPELLQKVASAKNDLLDALNLAESIRDNARG